MSESASFLLTPYVPQPEGGDIGLVYQPDHAGEAASRLISQFDDAAKLHALVRALVRPIQDLELAAFELMDSFDVDDAVGDQLDKLGAILDEAREGRGDAYYRAYIKARIAANNSNGTPLDVYRVTRMLLGEDVLSLRLTAVPSAHFILEIAATTLQFPWDDAVDVPPDLVAKAVADAVFRAISDGISFTLFYQFGSDEETFTFADADTADADTGRGFADDDLIDPGGQLIGAEERF
jgi:Protein of unknown function (DUF2612)